MKLFLPFVLAFGGSGLLSAQIAITEVGPAASYLAPGLPGAGVAQGSYFYIKGTGLATEPLLFSGPTDYTIGVDLGGTRVRVTIGPIILDAFPYFVSPTQVNVLLPSRTPIGAGTVTVLYNGTQAVFPITVVRAAYGIFTLNSAGTGPAVVTNAVNNQVITLTNVLHPGDRGTLWGTGLGAVNFADNQPAQLIRLEAGVTMFVGGNEAAIEYAGRTPGLSGLDQINFVVPAGVSGCAVPIVVRVANAPSNFATIPVAPSGVTCADTGGLTSAELARAQTAGLNYGLIDLERRQDGTAETPAYVDSLTAAFRVTNYEALLRSNLLSGPTVGACMVNRGRNVLVGGIVQVLDPGELTVATSVTTRNVPGGPGFPQLLGSTAGRNLFLESGPVTVTGRGGAQVGPLTASLTLPAAIEWTNQAAITAVGLNQDLAITWKGGTADELVVIRGSATDTATNLVGNFVCYERATAGQFVVPAWALSALPLGTPGLLSVGNTRSVRFAASGLDVGIATYTLATSSTLNYQ